MSFEFPVPQAAKLTSVTPRTEKHGDDDVFAISLGISITGSNTLLDKLSPTLRTALYKAADEDTETLPGVEQATPLLRAHGIEVMSLKGALQGWTIGIDHGIDEADPITLGDAKIDKFRVKPMQGGSIELLFRVGSNDIDATEAGLLCSHLRQEINFTLKAPEVNVDEPVIDGTGEEFERDHPLFDGATPESALADSLGSGDGGPHDDEPVDPDGSQQSSDADDATDFEAGAAQAMSKAGLTPKGARGRKTAAAH